jgi:hypothetical protein
MIATPAATSSESMIGRPPNTNVAKIENTPAESANRVTPRMRFGRDVEGGRLRSLSSSLRATMALTANAVGASTESAITSNSHRILTV